jgi:hypothetical protein
MADIKKALALKHTNPTIKVLEEYYNLLDIFL